MSGADHLADVIDSIGTGPDGQTICSWCHRVIKGRMAIVRGFNMHLPCACEARERHKTMSKRNVEEDGSRYWADDDPWEKPFKWTVAVVDEEAGGVIAYFATANDAKLFIAALEASDEGACGICLQSSMRGGECSSCGAVSCAGCAKQFEPRVYGRDKHCAQCLGAVRGDAKGTKG